MQTTKTKTINKQSRPVKKCYLKQIDKKSKFYFDLPISNSDRCNKSLTYLVFQFCFIFFSSDNIYVTG